MIMKIIYHMKQTVKDSLEITIVSINFFGNNICTFYRKLWIDIGVYINEKWKVCVINYW